MLIVPFFQYAVKLQLGNGLKIVMCLFHQGSSFVLDFPKVIGIQLVEYKDVRMAQWFRLQKIGPNEKDS